MTNSKLIDENIELRLKLIEAEDKISSLMEVIAYGCELEGPSFVPGKEFREEDRYAYRLDLSIMGEKLMSYTEVSSKLYQEKSIEGQIKRGFLVSAAHYIHMKVKMRKLLLKKFERVT